MNKLIWVSVLSLLSSEVLNAHKEEEGAGAASASVSAKVKVNGVELAPEVIPALNSAVWIHQALPEGDRPKTLKVIVAGDIRQTLDRAFSQHYIYDDIDHYNNMDDKVTLVVWNGTYKYKIKIHTILVR